MQGWAQWWLVITSPWGDTMLAEQPWASRTEAARTFSNQLASGSKPYFAFTAATGKLSKVHMPSSAWASGDRSSKQPRKPAVNERFIGTSKGVRTLHYTHGPTPTNTLQYPRNSCPAR